MTTEELARAIDKYTREVMPYEYEDEQFDGVDTVAETLGIIETEPEYMLGIFRDEVDTWRASDCTYERRLYEEALRICDELARLVCPTDRA